MSKRALILTVIACITLLITIVLVIVFRPRSAAVQTHLFAPPASLQPFGVRLTPGQMRWNLGPLTDTIDQNPEALAFLASIPAPDKDRILAELARYDIVAYDRTKPSTKPRGNYFQTDEPPIVDIRRRDSVDPSDVKSMMTKDLQVYVDKYVIVQAEVSKSDELTGHFYFEDIWEKVITVHFNWYWHDEYGIALGKGGVKIMTYSWKTSYHLILPATHPQNATATAPAKETETEKGS